MNETGQQKKPSLKSQSAWLLFAKIVGFGFAFLLPLLVVRFLSQEKVGVYRQVFLVIANAVSILPLGFSMSAFYFLNRETAARRGAVVFNILLFNFAIGGAACLVLFLFPQWLGNLFRNAEMTSLAPKIGVVVWLWIFSAFLETVAVANQESRLATVFIILAQLTKTVLMALAVLIFATVESFLYAAMAQAALQTLVLLVYLNSRFPRFWRQFDFAFFRVQMFYALPFGLAGLLWTLQTDIHNYFVGYRFSTAEFAVYAYGCFQLPLLAMLSESVTSVLIPRMSELQARGDKAEMIRLTARAMQKLAFFFFPVYVFLFITAETFITTLFTGKFAASVPIFLINLTLLPFDIWVIDPITRAFKELGRFLLTLRVVVLVMMVAALYYGIQYFDLRGMIAIVVVTSVTERFVSSFLIARKLGVRSADARLLNGIWKTAFASLAAGVVLFLIYWLARDFLHNLGANIVNAMFAAPKPSIADFAAGAFTLGVCFAVFAPVYLILANAFDLMDDEEKAFIRTVFSKIRFFKGQADSRPLTTDR
ncbi:MAG: oligosaccharide flippase family protein [Acidobacteriota bacterium]|nr:oligosaccharide flippase family protein [Acidobacteriota bacterium]